MNRAACCGKTDFQTLSCKAGFKGRVIALATSASASPVAYGLLFLIGAIEACLCPMPIDEALISLGAIKPKSALWYSLMAVLGAVCGGFIGYAIGNLAYQTIGNHLIGMFGWEQAASEVLTAYRNEGIKTLASSGFMPLPYALFTMLAGANQTLPIAQFAAAAALGRTIRFLPLGIVFRLWGQKFSPFISRHIDKVIFITGGAMIVASLIQFLS